jgi:hypothetical protein
MERRLDHLLNLFLHKGKAKEEDSSQPIKTEYVEVKPIVIYKPLSREVFRFKNETRTYTLTEVPIDEKVSITYKKNSVNLSLFPIDLRHWYAEGVVGYETARLLGLYAADQLPTSRLPINNPNNLESRKRYIVENELTVNQVYKFLGKLWTDSVYTDMKLLNDIKPIPNFHLGNPILRNRILPGFISRSDDPHNKADLIPMLHLI